MRNSLIIASIISFFSFQLSAQIDQEFWFAAPDLTQGTQGEINGNAFRDRPIQVVLSTLVDPAQVTIWQPATLSFAPIAGILPMPRGWPEKPHAHESLKSFRVQRSWSSSPVATKGRNVNRQLPAEIQGEAE